MEDYLEINPEELGKEQEELIPEGEQLFIIYNMWFGKFNSNPNGARRATDFSVPLFFKFMHHKTGLFLSRLDNGQDEPFNRMLFVKRVGNIDTRKRYYEFMKAIKAPARKVGNGVIFHVRRNGKMILTPYDDTENPGPLGMPIKLLVVHKEVPVLVAKEGAEKNNWGRFDKEDLIPKTDEDGKVITQIKEFIVVDEPTSDDFKSKAESGWPIVLPLTEEEAKIRGMYYKPEGNVELDDEELTEPQKLEW